MTTPALPDTPPDRSFQEFLAEGEMRMQQCGDCSRFFFFPRTICPHCGSTALAWQRLAGTGRVYSSTTVRQRPDRGGDYNVSLVDLPEGVRLMSRVLGVPPEQVEIGMDVVAAIADADGGKAIVFHPRVSR